MRHGMVIDTTRCIGCHACTMACKQEKGTPPEMWWSKVIVSETGKFPHTHLTFLPLLCMHCKNPPCVDVCPTGASFKREDGIVIVDYDKCMGCGYCRVACPYDARTFVEELKPHYPGRGLTPYEQVMYEKHQAGVAEKCDFCAGRLARGEEPACVKTCVAYARHFGDLDDPDSEVSRLIAKRDGFQLSPELGTDPSVYYLK